MKPVLCLSLAVPGTSLMPSIMTRKLWLKCFEAMGILRLRHIINPSTEVDPSQPINEDRTTLLLLLLLLLILHTPYLTANPCKSPSPLLHPLETPASATNRKPPEFEVFIPLTRAPAEVLLRLLLLLLIWVALPRLYS